MKTIKYQNKTIAYTVSKAKVKNFYISIQNGEVVIKAPWYATGNQIQSIVEEKRDWIMRKLEEYKDSPKKAKEYADGKIVIILPLRLADQDNTEQIKKMIDKMYYMIAEREVEQAFEKIRRMVGLAPEEYRIRKVKSVWGSCSSNKKITINQNLMMYSRKALEYVVLHETCHLKYMNHSKKFWEMVEKYMPDYKEAEKELKK